jgi:large subunit ribosomal protein L6
MSRVGKKPISIPENVEVKIEDSKVTVKGPKGELSREVRPEIKVEVRPVKSDEVGAKQFNRVKDKEIVVSPQKESKETQAFWGLTRALIANMVKGVTEGYEKKLEIQGVGFKANLEGQDLVLNVGFSHPVKIKAPEGTNFSVEKNIITVSGIDIEKVSQTAAKIRKIKPPEPYKGKGIKYLGEQIRRKLGKKAVTTG